MYGLAVTLFILAQNTSKSIDEIRSFMLHCRNIAK